MGEGEYSPSLQVQNFQKSEPYNYTKDEVEASNAYFVSAEWRSMLDRVHTWSTADSTMSEENVHITGCTARLKINDGDALRPLPLLVADAAL